MKITVVGCGYVGVTTGVCLASVGHRVQCVDTAPERVAEQIAALRATVDAHAAWAGEDVR